MLILLLILALLTPPSAPWPTLTLTAQPSGAPGVTRLTITAHGAGQLGILLTRSDMALAGARGGGTAGTVCRSIWLDPEIDEMRVWLACGYDLDIAAEGTITLDVPGDAPEIDVWLQFQGERRREAWIVSRGARLVPQVYAPAAGVNDASAVVKNAGPDPARVLDLCGHIPDNGAPWYYEDGLGNPRPCPGTEPAPLPTPEPAPTPAPVYPPRVVLAPVWR